MLELKSRLGIAFAIVFAVVTTAHAEVPFDVVEWATNRLQSNEIADFSDLCKIAAAASTCDHISSDVFMKLLKSHPAPGTQIYVISHANVSGRVDLTGYSQAPSLKLSNCTFDSKLILTGAHFDNDLIFEGSEFKKGVDADNLHVNGQLFLRSNTLVKVEPFNLTNVSVKADISIANSTFETPLILRRGSVGSKLLIQTSHFNAGLDANFMDIGGSLNIGPDTTILRSPLLLDATSIGGRMDIFHSKSQSGISAKNTVIKGDAYFSELSETGASDISGIRTVGDLLFNDSVFVANLNASRLNVGGSLLITDGSRFDGKLIISDSIIGNTVKLTNSKIAWGLVADRLRLTAAMQIGPDVDLGKALQGSNSLIDAYIGGDLTLDKVRISGAKPLKHVDGGGLLCKRSACRRDYLRRRS